jgi:hypothetical protein
MTFALHENFHQYKPLHLGSFSNRCFYIFAPPPPHTHTKAVVGGPLFWSSTQLKADNRSDSETAEWIKIAGYRKGDLQDSNFRFSELCFNLFSHILKRRNDQGNK